MAPTLGEVQKMEPTDYEARLRVHRLLLVSIMKTIEEQSLGRNYFKMVLAHSLSDIAGKDSKLAGQMRAELNGILDFLE